MKPGGMLPESPGRPGDEESMFLCQRARHVALDPFRALPPQGARLAFATKQAGRLPLLLFSTLCSI
jgi:hypothetical protein